MAAEHVTMAELDPGDQRLDEVWAVLSELRPGLSTDEFSTRYRDSWEQGLRITAAYVEGRCLGVAGWRRVTSFAYGSHVYVDDLVTAADARSTGVGRQLLAMIEARAASEGCRVVRLDSGVQRHGAHRFYFREGYRIASHHFVKEVGPDAG